MTEAAFDTLGAARKLGAAGIEAGQAEAIVEVMGQSVSQLVTAERFEAGLAALHAKIDSGHAELHARIDSGLAGVDARIDTARAELRADFMRALLIAVGVVVAANALTIAIVSMLMGGGAGIDAGV